MVGLKIILLLVKNVFINVRERESTSKLGRWVAAYTTTNSATAFNNNMVTNKKVCKI